MASTRPERIRDALQNLADAGVDLTPPRPHPDDDECRHRWHDLDGEREPACPSCGVEADEGRGRE